eukprot:CAMPEP_0173219858 /NCGR_PEP_ID=MMETSP1142-20121109/1825_1 /TAXON_ID=483371 /ORGANISM="non described non described, Strain CCMP2298" /LENGTH=93 /DNA_ID=CAMNT_0014147677 /DNA_START=161 /DNA_END=442 /DNA_ORIENTATION=-
MYSFLRSGMRPVLSQFRLGSFTGSYASLGLGSWMPSASALGLPNMQITRFLNRNARRPKKANHGKRPVSHARRWEKRGKLTSRSHREKIFGFW